MPNWRVIRALISALGALLAATATGWLTWVQLQPGKHSKDVELGAIFLIGAVALLSTVTRSIRIFTIERAEKQRRKIDVALRSLVWAVFDDTGGTLPVRSLGASAWQIRGWGPRQHLVRIGKERVAELPAPSGLRWTKGKGIIGQCWATERELTVNTERIDSSHGTCSAAQWEKVKKATRMNLSYEEYKRIRKKYGTVIAVPIHDSDGKIVGVLSLDAPDGYFLQLDTKAVLEDVSEAARVIAGLIT